VQCEVGRGVQAEPGDGNRRGLCGCNAKPEQLGKQPGGGGDRQRCSGTADQLTAVSVDIEHGDRGQTQRDDCRTVGKGPHQRRRQ